jgi:AcrR family transcriptional regulator
VYHALDPMRRAEKKPRGVYHHGRLHDAIVGAAAEIVAESGPLELTIRAVAERLGVTHAAIYHHFEDRTGIVVAVAERCFRRLDEAMDRAAKDEKSPLRRYRAMGLAYARYALRNPRLYGVMFGAEAATRHAHPALAEAAQGVFARIRGAIVECQAAGLLAKGSPEEHTLFCWSAVHGFASLSSEHQLEALGLDGRDSGALAEVIVERIFTGLGERPSA